MGCQTYGQMLRTWGNIYHTYCKESVDGDNKKMGVTYKAMYKLSMKQIRLRKSSVIGRERLTQRTWSLLPCSCRRWGWALATFSGSADLAALRRRMTGAYVSLRRGMPISPQTAQHPKRHHEKGKKGCRILRTGNYNEYPFDSHSLSDEPACYWTDNRTYERPKTVKGHSRCSVLCCKQVTNGPGTNSDWSTAR